MSDTTDIVVVGAGIMGLATAYQVARRSNQRVVVVERGGGPGEGSTGASSAIVRQRYTHPEVIRIARGGLLAFRNWGDFTGLAEPRARLQEIGVLWMTGEDRAQAEAETERLRGEGVDAVVLDAGMLRDRFPGLSACGVPFDLSGETEHECADHDAFIFEDEGGYFDPVAACGDLVDAARNAGVEISFRSEVTAIARKGDRVVGIELADGTAISAETVVNAAGPWCNRINAMAGLELSWELVPTRVQVMYRELPPEVPRPIPVVADSVSGIYLRPESADQQLVVGSVLEEDEREETDPDTYNPNADRVFLDTKIHALHHRLPDLPHRGLLSGIAGLYTVNRVDVHPLLGPTALDGYAVINGFSGHGFKESLMCAGMLATILTGETFADDADVPLDFFSVEREPLVVKEKNVLA
jgi:glycine/D-amino acid oxidase-like deaminating enzyme